MQWCRDTIATSRRPYGISWFDLSLIATPVKGRPRHLFFQRRDPSHLYEEGSDLVAAVREFVRMERSRVAGAASELAVVLSSWGDITHAALVT